MTLTAFEFWMFLLVSALSGANVFAFLVVLAEEVRIRTSSHRAESLKTDSGDETDKAKCQCNAMKKEKPFDEWGRGEVGQHLVIEREHFGMDEVDSFVESKETRGNG